MEIEAILSQMTLEEKLQQLTQLSGVFFNETDTTKATGPKSNVGITDKDLIGIGSVLNFADGNTVRKIQNNHLDNDRNRIPMMFMMDVVHGCKTIYPIPLAMGATFNPELVQECASMAARESKAMGIDVVFAPMVDLVRDARWGRVMESTGEDVYLNGLYAAAQVRGFQREGVLACVKHFAAYGAPEAGRDYNTVDMSELTMRQYYLPAYKAALDAGARIVMTSFNSFNGVPVAANKKLVKGLLRDEWGFDGVVISDYNAFREMINHGIAKDETECAYKAISATNDIEMMSATYLHSMKELIAEGKVSEKQVDDAVRRVLALKKDAGLFEDPYLHCGKTQVECERKYREEVLTPENREIVRRAAEKSAVLLKNEGVLPFSGKEKRIAVIGPFGDTGDIIGFWHCYGDGKDTVKLTEGIRKAVPDARVEYEKGVDGAVNAKANPDELKRAAALAASSDAVILTLGEPQGDSGEGNSKQCLELPEAQYELLEEVLAANENVAVILFTGRPLALRRVREMAPAVLVLWQPGTEGGNAAANLLFGRVVPEGKLPMSFPAVTGQCPIHYDQYRTGRPRWNDSTRAGYCSSYIDGQNAPLYPFGFGLSYTKFEYSNLAISSDTMESGGKIAVSVTVKNIGEREGTETAQLYVCDKSASVVRPVKELKGIRKVTIPAGAETRIAFEINEEMLKFYNEEMEFAAEAGDFLVYIGGDSNCCQSVSFRLL